MEHLSLEDLIITLLTADDGPQTITFCRHPGGLKVKATRQDGQAVSAVGSDGKSLTSSAEGPDDFEEVAFEFLASLLPAEPGVTPSAETSPLPTLPSEAPAAPLPPPHSDADLDFLQEEASDPEAATPEPPAH